MRRLFLVFAKLIGLLQIYWGLTYLGSVVMFVGQLARMEATETGSFLLQVAGIAGFALVSFGMAWVLIARTEWLADKFKVPAGGEIPGITDDVLLLGGVKLIGVYILAGAIPGLVRAVAEAGAYGLWEGHLSAIGSRLVPSVLQLALALFLTIRSEKVIQIMAWGERAGGKRIIIGSLIILAFLLIIGRGLTLHPWLQTGARHSSRWSGRSVMDSERVAIKNTNAPAAPNWYVVSEADELLVTNEVALLTNSQGNAAFGYQQGSPEDATGSVMPETTIRIVPFSH